jgi:hypothetical protein
LAPEVASRRPQCAHSGATGCSRAQKPQAMRCAQRASWSAPSSWHRSQG